VVRQTTTVTAVQTLQDITVDIVLLFKDAVSKRGLAGKTESHLYNRIRSVLRFCLSRGTAPDAIQKALSNLSILKASSTATSLAPSPISREDFHKLLDAATGDNRAFLLLMLNAALYQQEAVRLDWSHIVNGNLIAHRGKKGKVVRVAPLWQETIEALGQIKKTGAFIFRSETGKRLTVTGSSIRFQKLRKAAKVDEAVKASHCRDGAATAAAEANVNPQIVSLLLGHRSGIVDHYAKRNPAMVRVATDAVYKKYFG
jgi:integrase